MNDALSVIIAVVCLVAQLAGGVGMPAAGDAFVVAVCLVLEGTARFALQLVQRAWDIIIRVFLSIAAHPFLFLPR